MSIRKNPFVLEEYYHLYNRGNSKQKIFHDHEDYNRFVSLLYVANSNRQFKTNLLPKNIFSLDRDKPLVSIGAYCLMPNHFHLLITQSEEGDISKFMQKLSTAYSMYYNKKYERTGGLFEGKFKSEHIGDDRYCKYIFSYIHLNPIKLIDSHWKENGIRNVEQTLDFLKKYKYSSYLDYLDKNSRQVKALLDEKYFPDYFPSQEKFKKEILEWIQYGK